MKRLRPPRFLAALAAALLLAGCGQQATRPAAESTPSADSAAAVECGLRDLVVFAREPALRFCLPGRMAHYNVPGVSLTVLADGEIAWSAAWGVRTAGHTAPVRGDTLFQAGSLAKPLTAFAVMRMREAGLLDLDVDIGTYLSSFTIPAGAQTPDNPVTLRHALNHTAGLTPGGYEGYEPGTELPSDQQTLRGSAPANTRPLAVVAPPGTALAYSGHGYTLTEQALQDLTGEEFGSLMGAWVLAPLALENSSFSMPLPSARRNNAARGHETAGLPLEGGWRLHPEQAAAGLWTTSADLARFLLTLHHAYQGRGELFSRAAAQEMFTEHLDGHAFGWILRSDGFVAHGGGNAGYRAYMLLDPESGDGAAVLTNGDQGSDLIVEILRSVSDTYGWSAFTPRVMERFTPDPAVLARLEGTYRFSGGAAVAVFHDATDATLDLRFPNGDVYRMVATHTYSFVHPATGTPARFAVLEDGATLELYGETGVRETTDNAR
jgi:CubicO group peptidase (beta-lactamase class C family)